MSQKHRSWWIYFLFVALLSKGQIHVSGSMCTAYKVELQSQNPQQGGQNNSQSNFCSPSTLFFDLSTNNAVNAWKWEFGDGSTSTERNAKHSYLRAGTFTVKMTNYINGSVANTFTKDIEISDLNAPLLKGKPNGVYEEKCSGPIKLDPYEGSVPPTGAKYLWFPNGETTRTIDIEEAGCYSVEVTNKNGCSKIAQIEVKFCLASPNQGPSQNEWYFGNGGGITFSKQPLPDSTDCTDPKKFCLIVGQETAYKEGVDINPLNKPHNLNADGTIAMAYSKAGELKLYSDGKTVYTGQGQKVDLVQRGSTTVYQSTVIVPKETCNECPNHQYYVISVNTITKTLVYSLIDIRGGAQAVEQNITLATNISGRVTAAPLQTGGYALVTHEAENNVFKIFKIDKEGITSSTAIQGSVFGSSDSQNGIIKASVGGSVLALSIREGNQNYVELYNVNPKTGQISNLKRIAVGSSSAGITGIEFSIDPEPIPGAPPGPADVPTYMYVAVAGEIFQFNLKNPNITSSKKSIFNGGENIGGLLLYLGSDAADNTIVVSFQGSGRIGAINFFDSTNPVVISQAGRSNGVAYLGLPIITKPPQDQEGTGFQLKYRGRCEGNNTVFLASQLCSGQGQAIYHWDFGDGETQTIPKAQATIHVYKKPGRYNLKLRVQVLGCGERTYEAEVIINPGPAVGVPSIVPFCDLPSGVVNLDVEANATGGTNFSYKWIRLPANDEGSEPKVTLTKLDNYSLYVENQEGCFISHPFEVKRICKPELFVPDIFTPNPDLANEVFQFFPQFVSNLKITIFDRWGNVVFQQKRPPGDAPIVAIDQSNVNTIRNMFWNGQNLKGEPCPPGVYAYELEYVEFFTIQQFTRTKQGSVVLYR